MTHSEFKKLPKDEQRDFLINLANTLTLKRKDPLINFIDMAHIHLNTSRDTYWSVCRFDYTLKELNEIYQTLIMAVIS